MEDKFIIIFFSMQKNQSVVNFSSQTLLARGNNSMLSPHNKNHKVQGFDKCIPGQSFAAKVQKIKTKPKKECLQETYVKGLQDQIHYLEMELKLLKQKEIAKHSQVDQLETFFGDGIPINQNILALKNGFNQYKSGMDKKIIDLQKEKTEREYLIQSLRAKIEQNSKNIHIEEKKYQKELTEKSNTIHEKVKNQALLKQQIEFEDENLKVIKAENKKTSDLIIGLQRTKELLVVSFLRADNNKFNKLNKVRQTISERQKELERVGKIYRELRKQDDDNSYVLNVQQSNIKLKKKIISQQKQLNTLHIKCEQKKMDLEAKLKQRVKQINSRLDMQRRLEKIKEDIEIENNMTMEELEKVASDGEAKILQGILDKNRKLTKYADYYGDLLYKIEQKLYAYGQKKPDLKKELQINQHEIQLLQKQLQKEKERHSSLNSQIAYKLSKSQHISEIVPPTIDKLKKEEERIKGSKLEREKLVQEIKMKEKQLELMEILKCLSLQQVEISSSSNSSIQDRLIDFMRNWETLARY